MGIWSDIAAGDSTLTYGEDVGYQSDGTYSAPPDAQPVNTPWDTGGGALGGYSKDLMDIFKYGVGVASRNYDTRQLLDYKRYEATQGGAFVQGRPTASAAITPAGMVISPMMMILLAVGAFVLLKK